MQSSGESMMLSKQRRQRSASRRASCFVVADLDLAEPDAPLRRRRRDRPPRDRVVAAVEPAEAACRSSTRTSWPDAISLPVSAAWIEAAARRPSAIASIRLRGPCATSPPAQIRGCDVRSVARRPARRRRGSLELQRRRGRSRSAAWPTARITVSAGMTSSVPAGTSGANRPCSSNTDATAIVSSPVTRPVADEPVRTAPVDDRIPSRSASAISSGSAGISSGDSSATTVTSRTPAAARGARTSRVVVIARRASSAEVGSQRDRFGCRSVARRHAARCAPRRTRRCRRRPRRPARRARHGSPG